MSIQNFPKIPKIVLKKTAEQVKDTKNPNYESPILIFRKNVTFYVALPLRIPPLFVPDLQQGGFLNINTPDPSSIYIYSTLKIRVINV